MSIALLVMTDGRDDYLSACIDQPSPAGWELVTEWWMHDDTGDDAYRAELAARYPAYVQLGSGPRRGFGGAIAHSWARLCDLSTATYVLHLEADFLFTRPVDLGAMVRVLATHPNLAQIALRRQPWNDEERRAGGIVEQHPDDYTEVVSFGDAWLEHRRFFTTNPSIYRRSLCRRGWPIGRESEGRFGIALFAEDPATRCAFWGARDSGPWVEHIGHERIGTGY